MHRTATNGRALALLLAGLVGWTATGAGAQPAARPDQPRAPAPPAQRMPDPNALRTPAPPSIGPTPAVPAPADVPAPAPRLATPPPAAPPVFPPPDARPVAPAPVGETLRVLFAKAGTGIPSDAATDIDGLAARMAATGAGRVQITAYADEADARNARRLALARAEAVRSRFVLNGVRSDRINLRPLGDAAGDGPADRADILIVN